MTSLRIIKSSNPLEQRLGILPMSDDDRRFWDLRRHKLAAASQASPTAPRGEGNRGVGEGE